MNKKYSTGFSQSLLFSREEAMRLRSNIITSEHLLLGLLRDRENTAVRLIETIYKDLDEIKRAVEAQLGPPSDDPVTSPEQLIIAPSATAVLKNSVDEAFKFNALVISTIHLLLAILKEDDTAASKVLNARGIVYDRIIAELKPEHKQPQSEFYLEDNDNSTFDERPMTAQNSSTRQKCRPGETPVLDKFGTVFTKSAI